MKLVVAPLESTADIEAVRAALATYFRDQWSHIKPAPCAGKVINDENFNDSKAVLIGDLRYILEVKIPEHIQTQHYGRARTALHEAVGAAWGGGLVSKNEIYNLEIVPLAKAA